MLYYVERLFLRRVLCCWPAGGAVLHRPVKTNAARHKQESFTVNLGVNESVYTPEIKPSAAIYCYKSSITAGRAKSPQTSAASNGNEAQMKPSGAANTGTTEQPWVQPQVDGAIRREHLSCT